MCDPDLLFVSDQLRPSNVWVCTCGRPQGRARDGVEESVAAGESYDQWMEAVGHLMEFSRSTEGAIRVHCKMSEQVLALSVIRVKA
jgi:hypothetical protein